MVSDDTEHTVMVAQSMGRWGGDVDRFLGDFGRRLRLWFALIPAGIGRATLRACVRLWFGADPRRSGVFSAGNGPVMRAPIIGVLAESVEGILPFAKASTDVTHTDPKAYEGAVAVALAAHLAATGASIQPTFYLDALRQALGGLGEELDERLEKMVTSLGAGEGTEDFAKALSLEKGISGYTNDTVPMVCHAWLSHQDDYKAAVEALIRCGGDADTTAAIVGGIIGARVGEDGIPKAWLQGVRDWPMSIAWLRRLGQWLATGEDEDRPPEVGILKQLLRNLGFFAIVWCHVLRRMLPPY